MGIRVYKPTSAARRFTSVLTFEELTKKAPEKSLLAPIKNHAGRNFSGKISVRHRAAATAVSIVLSTSSATRTTFPPTWPRSSTIRTVSAFIALIDYADGEKRYILAPLDLKVGDTVVSGPDADIKPGNCLPIANIPLGTLIHNIEIKPGKGGQMVRSAGNAAQLMAKENGVAQVRLPSGEVRKVPLNARATIGSVGNSDHENVRLGKAGRVRAYGRASQCPRRCYEPRRSPARRRRGQEPRWYACSHVSLGQAYSGRQDSQAQEVFRQAHRQARRQEVILPALGARGPLNAA